MTNGRGDTCMRFKLLLLITTLLFVSIGANAGEWIADNETNCKVWNDNPQPKETISWSGDCADGYAYGSGIIIWYKDKKENGRYKGEMRRGKNNGKGSYIWANGDKYEGDFVDNKRTGKGTSTWSNGNKYEGDFVDDQYTGKGTFTNPNGIKCTGIYKNGRPVGTVKCTVGKTSGQGMGTLVKY
jgi:hypothetical protein